jgi:hypothetical protein
MIAAPFFFLFLIYPKPLPNGGSIRKRQSIKTLPLHFMSAGSNVSNST